LEEESLKQGDGLFEGCGEDSLHEVTVTGFGGFDVWSFWYPVTVTLMVVEMERMEW
jgi:hypothetical protein